MKWKCYINPGVKRSWAYWDEWDRVAWEAVQCANLSFASDRFLFINRRVASFHLGAGNSRLLLTDKFNLNLQYCMLGINKCFFSLIRAVELLNVIHLTPSLSSFPIQPFKNYKLVPMGFHDGIVSKVTGYCILNFNTKAYSWLVPALINIVYKIKESLSFESLRIPWKGHSIHHVLKVRCSYC